MTPRQKQNLFISAGIAAIFIIIIYYQQKVYLPVQQKEALGFYQKWINNIDETLISETNFIIKSHEYKKTDKYKIHGVEVERLKPNEQYEFFNYYSDSIKFSLGKVMEIVYNGLNEDSYVALLSDKNIIWSSWKLTPHTSNLLRKLTDSTRIYKQRVLPEKVIIGGNDYYVFAIADKIGQKKNVQILGLVSVKDFNNRASTLPIRRISYIFTILVFCFLLIPAFKLFIIQEKEELRLKDFRLIISGLILITFLIGGLWGLVNYKKEDRDLFCQKLKESTISISNYFEMETLRVLGYLSSSQEDISKNKYGFMLNNSNEDENINITSIYLMDNDGEEIGNWTKRDSVSFGNYAHRDYFKAFSKDGYNLHTINPLLQTKNDSALTIAFVNNNKRPTDQKYITVNNINSSYTPSVTQPVTFFLQTISSLIDGKVKNVISMASTTIKNGVIACSYEMKKMHQIIHPPGYNYAIFDKYGTVYFHTNITEVSGNNIFYFFQDTDDFLWKLNHRDEFFDTYKISGRDSFCYIRQVENLPNFFVMAYYTNELRQEVRGQAWLKFLFIFVLIAMVVLFTIFKVNLKRWHLTHWLITPVLCTTVGAFISCYFYQYETKQLEAWTVDECCSDTKVYTNPFMVFSFFQPEDKDKSGVRKLPFLWNRLAIPYTISDKAYRYRRLLKEPDFVFSKGNDIIIHKKRVATASILNFNKLPHFLFLLLLLSGFSLWLRNSFVMPRRMKKRTVPSVISEENFEEIWNGLSFEEKYLLKDLSEDEIANLKNRTALKSLYRKGLILPKNFNSHVMVSGPLKDLIIEKLKSDTELLKYADRKGKWSRMGLPLYIFIFGCMVSISVFKEDWLNSFIGIVTLLTTGLGAVSKLFAELKVAGIGNNSNKEG